MGIAALASLIVLVLFPIGTAPVSDPADSAPVISNIIEIPISVNQDQTTSTTTTQPTPDRDAIVVTSSSTDTEPVKQAPIPMQSEDIVIDYTTGDRKINALPKQCIQDNTQPFLLIECDIITLLITEYVVPSIPHEDLIAEIIELKQANQILREQAAEQNVMIMVLLESLRGIQIIIEDTLAHFE